MYKKLISSILIVSLLNLFGCYSFQNMSKEEQSPDFLLEEHSIKVILNSGEPVYSDAYHHTIVREPLDYVIGTGIKYQRKSKKDSKFEGKIFRHQIDSSRLSEKYYTYRLEDNSKIVFNEGKYSEQYNIYWLNDSSRVVFEKGNYIDINPDSEKGLWVAKNNTYEIINFDEVKQIEIDKVDTGATIVVTVLVVDLLVALAVGSQSIGRTSFWE